VEQKIVGQLKENKEKPILDEEDGFLEKIESA
jgi:hypothetical protein